MNGRAQDFSVLVWHTKSHDNIISTCLYNEFKNIVLHTFKTEITTINY